MAVWGQNGLVVHLDDFLIVAETEEECKHTFNTLIELLTALGFRVAWDKVVESTQKLTFLGTELESMNMAIRLQEEKVQTFCDLLDNFSLRSRASLG